MTTEKVTLIAALIAALTSVITLGLNSRLVLLREKRMLLWQKELDRILEVEEVAGKAVEIALSHSSSEVIEAEFVPLHSWLRHAAGRFSRYKELRQAIRELNHHCAVVVADKVSNEDYREWAEKVPALFESLIAECDKITRRKET